MSPEHGNPVGRVEWEEMKWLNRDTTERLRSAIGYITPQDPEEALYASLNALEKVA